MIGPDIAQRAIDAALAAGATYADVRIVRQKGESITVKNNEVETLSSSHEEGIGVRVVADGAWGFACTNSPDPKEIEETAKVAVRVARASARTSREPVELSEVEPARDVWKSELKIDPFDVPLEDKISLLKEADRAMRQFPKVRVALGRLVFMQEEKWFLSSEGAEIEQHRTESGGMISATAIEGDEVQTRSYPSSLEGFHSARGWEMVEEMDLPGHAEQTAKEACDLLSAPLCPSEETDLILDSSQMALQVHESCGHPTELDRVFGTERSYAGTSFLTPDKLGKLRYGSEIVNINADATLPGGLGTFGYDDEGVPAQRTDLVKSGIFTGYLTSRETAARLGQKSNATMRAESWNHLPLIRMTNINLDPGDWTLEEMIADTKSGVFASSTKSWSIDDLRLNFQFATETAREIKDGSLGRLLRNTTYQGRTPEFWASCDAIGNRKEWKLWGVLNCGKGEPAQAMHVGHGTSPARFRKVRVGVLKDED
ncbi:MAG: TldD/PmbA family protein [Armatimonadetes bacterium]|nr:TldD/PmbA family protein [Armatimonadota bacterium]NIM23861.1 TldD/PmbA family protein [Armatimonadota bacterium]NIM67740.1 TldD/PmbA family protein [Armatimonadota bacterium]NIM76249.1 TldD/PmbA family protein [Armatimonadota bacterium]NIN05942.1 TldD/PmbA family protein [Armatimonadota bacterium]